MKKLFLVLVAITLSSTIFAQSEKKQDKQENKNKKDNSEQYTVHKSGDAGGGSPTYSTGGLNPNPPKQNKQENKKTKKPNKS